MDMRRVRELHEWCIAIMESKNEDYSGENVSEAGMYGMATRLLDKVHRMKTLTKPDAHEPNHETVRETLRDIHNYSLIALMLDEGTWDKPYLIRSVYLAGPIDKVAWSVATQWRQTATELLNAQDIMTYDPTAPYRGTTISLKESADYIRKVNRSALANADAVLAYLPADTQMIGTIREIEYAKARGKFVVAYSDYPDSIEKSLESYDIPLYDHLSDAVVRLEVHNWGKERNGLKTARK